MKTQLLPEKVSRIMEKGIREERIEPFDDGTFQVDTVILNRIWNAGKEDGQKELKKEFIDMIDSLINKIGFESLSNISSAQVVFNAKMYLKDLKQSLEDKNGTN